MGIDFNTIHYDYKVNHIRNLEELIFIDVLINILVKGLYGFITYLSNNNVHQYNIILHC